MAGYKTVASGGQNTNSTDEDYNYDEKEESSNFDYGVGGMFFCLFHAYIFS